VPSTGSSPTAGPAGRENNLDLSDGLPRAESSSREDEEGPESGDVLSPESGQWLGFLADLTKKQAEHLRTSFSGLDDEWGGLAPGLLLLAGENRGQLADFLKQLVDQVARENRGPCLYVSFERSKGALRLQTLSRLSGAPAEEIGKGSFGKDSARWQDIVRAGEHAVEWLQRIYIVEARPGLSVTRIRELQKGLVDSGAGAPRLIAVDNLEKLENQTDLLHSVAELKELAEAFGVVVVGAATTMELVHERSADMAATFHDEFGRTTVKLSSSGSREPTVLRFQHRPELHRFTEEDP
jgi:DnaB-like helicase C terminal domain